MSAIDIGPGEDRGFVLDRGNGRFAVDWRKVAPESFLATSRLLRELSARREYAHGTLLDIGCGAKPYAPLFRSRVARYIGVDMPMAPHGRMTIDAFSSSLDLPFQAAAFDFVLCTEVIEHVPDPGRAFSEIARVLKPGGHALVSTPFMYRVHEAPYDFFRYTPFAYRSLAAAAGLEVVELAPRGGYPTVFADLITKGLSVAVGAVNSLLPRSVRAKRHLIYRRPVRWTFFAFQRLAWAALAGERLKGDVYTLGYVAVLRKPQPGGPGQSS